MTEIKIVVKEPGTIEIHGDNRGLTEIDKVLILNCLAEAMELTEEQKKIVGIIMYGGCLDGFGMTKEQGEALEQDMIRVITKMEENENETDAL